MDTISAIKMRRSVRNFSSKAVPDKVLFEILDAANHAPAAGGYYNWSFIVVKDSGDKELLANASYEQEFVKFSPVIVIVCSDSSKLESDFGEENGKKYALQNTAAAMQTMLLAATTFGVGSCWCSIDKEKAVRNALKIPEEVEIHGIVLLGYAKRVEPMVSKLDLGNITFFDEWDKKVRKTSILFPLFSKLEEAAKELGKQIGKRRVKKVVSKPIRAKQKTKKK